MPAGNREAEWLPRGIHLANNPLTFLGIFLTTTGGISWLFVLSAQREGDVNPYLGILLFLVLPLIFFAGLVLIPVGIWFKVRRERREGKAPLESAALSWQNADFRRLLSLIALATFANLIIGSYYTYAAVEYMGSVSFCGQACHTVMKPEFTAYQESPHFRVACTKCHVGEGASWFVRSKVSGTRQLIATIFHTYSKPIGQPVHSLRTARETCEQCHWPQRFNPSRLKVIEKYGEDEQNTHTQTVLMMKLAGGKGKGIHGFHLDPDVVIEYLSDPSRQTIPWVRYTSAAGESVEYASTDWNPEKAAQYERRTMECIDCHNRPTHEFYPVDNALNEAMASGKIDASLPNVKAKGVEILKAAYTTTTDAQERIPKALDAFYQSSHPEIYSAKRAAVERSAQSLLQVWERNVFPEMNIAWDTYQNHLGHTAFPGCFRCHDEKHTSTNGQTIQQDCSACHEMLAMEESKPEILTTLGISKVDP